MAESVLYLSWKDHTSELASVYTSLLENNFLVDCTISAGGQSLKAHKLILCACSSYFHRLFQEETGKHTFVVLLDAPFEILKAMIEFMYRGETQISHMNLEAFLTLARFLQIKGLNDHSKDNASKNVSSSSTGNVLRGLSEDNQNTSEVTGIKACPEDSPANVSQPLPRRSTDYQDAVHANSSLPFDGYTASHEEAWSSREYQQPLRGDGVPVTMDVVVKSESLYAVISENKNEEWRHVNSGEQVSGNFTNEMPPGTAPALGEQDLNQYSNCPESSLGNVESSEVLPPQQQHMQMEDEMSSDQDFVEQEECLPPAVFVPVNEEIEEPMDIPRDNTRERGKRAEPATSSFLQHPNMVKTCKGGKALPVWKLLNEVTMQEAIEQVREKRMGFLKAAKIYNVPRTTLFRLSKSRLSAKEAAKHWRKSFAPRSRQLHASRWSGEGKEVIQPDKTRIVKDGISASEKEQYSLPSPGRQDRQKVVASLEETQ